jgi:hypothetical protein
MCTCMFNYLLGQLGMGTAITRNETKQSDEISKTNPHKVILWFQQHWFFDRFVHLETALLI